MVDLRQLQAFVTVVEEGGFTRAAERLYQTQPALSLQIKNLEKYFDTTLFKRHEKELSLTDAGEILYGEAKKILDAVSSVKNELDELKGLKRGYLSVGASTLPGEYILPSIVAAYKAAYPEIRVELKISDTRQVESDLKNGRIQLGFLGTKSQDPHLQVDSLLEDEIVLIAPPDRQEINEWDNVPWNELILREQGSGTRAVIEKYLAERGVNVRPGLEIGSTQAIIRTVAASLGISFVPETAAQDQLRLGSIKRVDLKDGGIKRTIYMARLKNRYVSYAAREFIEMAKAIARQKGN